MTRKPNENDLINLLALLRLEQNPDAASIMFQDLVWSAEKLGPDIRSRALIHASAIMAAKGYSADVASGIFSALDEWPVLGRRAVDFAIVTVKEPELDAAKVAFDVDFERGPDHHWRGAYFYHVVLERKDKEPLTGVVTSSVTAGNSSMAAFLHTLFYSYNVRLCCLLGMAAGSKQMQMGDVVFADKVVDYGRRIATTAGEETDPVTHTPDRSLTRELGQFRPNRHGWHELIAERLVSSTPKKWGIELPAEVDRVAYQPEFKGKAVLAADELVEDDTVDERAGRVGPPRRTGALEMEGAGFASTCVEAEVPWLVIRGIADFGRVSGADRPREWQFLSTLGAGTALRLWLQASRFYG